MAALLLVAVVVILAVVGESWSTRGRASSCTSSRHGWYAYRFAEADRYAYEPRHPVAEPLGHHTGVGTGELRPIRVGRGQVSDTDDAVGA